MAHHDNMYLENLDEYINDENRIITYKWLSRTLSVHVNQAKQMLYTFVQKERKRNSDGLHVTYFVAAIVEDADSCQVQTVQVVPEELLEVVKSRCHHVTSCHVYSVQKSKLQNTDALFTADYDLQKEHIFSSNKYSAIKCTLAKTRSSEEMQHLKSTNANKKHSATPVTQSASKTPQNGQQSATRPPKKPTGIAGMFSAAKKKDDANKPKTGNSSAAEADAGSKTQSKVKSKGKQSGVMSFFAKEVNRPVPKTVKPTSSPVTEETTKKTESKHSAPAGKGGKKKADFDEEDCLGADKKRRRIQKISSDSSSEEEDMETVNDESPGPVLPSHSPSLSPCKAMAESEENTGSKALDDTVAHQVNTATRRRKKKRKLVSKTCVNDEGYMVTEKVWEEDSTDASETEDIIPPTPPVHKKAAPQPQKKSPGTKVSPQKGTKQMSLTSFFKKK